MGELQVEVSHVVDADYAIFEFVLPSAQIRVKMATGNDGAADASMLVANLHDLMLQSIERVKEDD